MLEKVEIENQSIEAENKKINPWGNNGTMLSKGKGQNWNFGFFGEFVSSD